MDILSAEFLPLPIRPSAARQTPQAFRSTRRVEQAPRGIHAQNDVLHPNSARARAAGHSRNPEPTTEINPRRPRRSLQSVSLNLSRVG